MRGGARILWAALVALALARLGLPFFHDMYGWGLNTQRFLAPAFVWPAWILMALALIPSVARRAEPACAGAGEIIATRGGMAMTLAAAGAAALVLAFPDHVRFVGDFLLRQGTVQERAPMGSLFPQALPLDVLLHYRWPVWLSGNGIADATGAARWMGAAEAALLAALAVAFARALQLRGAAAFAAAAVVLFGGYLGMFTGYSKAFVELVVLFAATGVFGLQALRQGVAPPEAGAGALLGAGLCVALALTLHRTAPALLPALVLLWAVWWRGRGAAPLRAPIVWLALAVPLATLGVMAPRIWSTVRGIDAVHFTPPEVQLAGGPLQAAFAGTRGVDLVNLLLLLSPLALVAPLLAFARRGRGWPREFVFLVMLAAPCALTWPFIHPAGGLARDWDDFTFGAVAVSMVAAWLVADVLSEPGAAPAEAPRRGGRKPRRPSPHGVRTGYGWLAVAVVAGVALPAVQWLALHRDRDRGLVRAEAFIEEAPRRSDAERARLLDYMGTITFQMERWRDSANAFRRAAELAPSPRLLQQWALAETRYGDFKTAQRAYWRVLGKDSTNVSAWLGLATVSSRFGDLHESRRAALRTLDLAPGETTALALLRYLESLPPAMRDSLTRLYPPRDPRTGAAQ